MEKKKVGLQSFLTVSVSASLTVEEGIHVTQVCKSSTATVLQYATARKNMSALIKAMDKLGSDSILGKL